MTRAAGDKYPHSRASWHARPGNERPVQDARLDTNVIDYATLVTYFVVVLGVGFAAKRYIRTSLDYFLSGRSLPA
jgi:hypothetical protein